MNTTQMPSPSRIDRDPDGRLVGLTVDAGAHARPGAMQWLIAVDGSDHSLRAVAEAARMAAQHKDCKLHIFIISVYGQESHQLLVLIGQEKSWHFRVKVEHV